MNPKAREIRAARESEWQRRERRRVLAIRGLWIAGGLAFVGMLVYLAWQQSRPVPRTGIDVPIQSVEHIEVGAAHEPYNSDPPTSGPHYAEPAAAGFYEAVVPDEALVHSLEHGYVIIWYNCQALTSSACDELKGQLRRAMQSAGNSDITNTPKLIAMPRPTMDTTLALTAWGRLDKFDSFDQQRIVNFIRVFRDRAPEPGAP